MTLPSTLLQSTPTAAAIAELQATLAAALSRLGEDTPDLTTAVLRTHLQMASYSLQHAAACAQEQERVRPRPRLASQQAAVLTVRGARGEACGQDGDTADLGFDIRLQAKGDCALVDVAVAGFLDEEVQGVPRMSLNLFVDRGVPRLLIYGAGEAPVLSVCALPESIAVQRNADAPPEVDAREVARTIRGALDRHLERGAPHEVEGGHEVGRPRGG